MNDLGLSGEQIDRLYHVLLGSMGVAFLVGMAIMYGLERVFHFC